MLNFTRPFLVAIILVTSVNGFAQQGSKKRLPKSMPSVESTMQEKRVYRKPAPPMVSLEPVFGVLSSNFSGLEGKNGASVDPVTGYQGGLNLLIGQRPLKFETGLLYSKRGSQFKNITLTDGTRYTATFELNYIDLPLLARYSFQDPQESHFFVRGGAVVSLLQESTFSVSDFTGTFNGPASMSAKEFFNSTDVRILVGAGGAVKLSQDISWVLKADYEMGVSKVNSTDIVNGLDIYNRSFSLTTGITVGI